MISNLLEKKVPIGVNLKKKILQDADLAFLVEDDAACDVHDALLLEVGFGVRDPHQLRA
jgi:hypothetical protein